LNWFLKTLSLRLCLILSIYKPNFSSSKHAHSFPKLYTIYYTIFLPKFQVFYIYFHIILTQKKHRKTYGFRHYFYTLFILTYIDIFRIENTHFGSSSCKVCYVVYKGICIVCPTAYIKRNCIVIHSIF